MMNTAAPAILEAKLPVSARSGVSTSHADAFQAIAERSEPNARRTVEANEATNINRRSIMNMMVSAAALTVGSKSIELVQPNDSVLLEMEEKIFEHHAAAREYDDEIERLNAIVQSEGKRLYDEALAEEFRQGRYLSPQERWNRVLVIPESQEYDRLSQLQSAHLLKMEEMIRTMWATPARTAAGRRAKVLVLLGCIMPVGWREIEADWGVQEARDLLIEFVGGEPAVQLRDQFRSGPIVA
jgi:hypothetical protein